MKTLILSCNTGEGHNSAAAAIKEVLDQRHEQCDIIDALGFVSQRLSKFVCNWHTRLYRYMPKAWDVGYRYAERHPSMFGKKLKVYRLLTKGTDRIYAFLKKNRYDAVICTHVFPALMMTEVLRRYSLDIHTSFVATDYTCSPITGDSRLDSYFVPHEDLTDEFVRSGIPQKKIAGTGMPVRRMFSQKVDKQEAKAQLGLPTDKKNVLLMCGSLGCGPMEDLVMQLVKALPENAILTVICGRNEKLYQRLAQDFPNGEIHLVGYTDQISLYMDSAELYLSKPGGLSISEALAKRLPMILIDAVAGCESYNLRFFLKKQWADTANTAEELARLCALKLQKNQTELDKVFPRPSAEAIADIIEAREKGREKTRKETEIR